MTELTIRVEQSQVHVTEQYMKFLNKVVIAQRIVVTICAVAIASLFVVDTAQANSKWNNPQTMVINRNNYNNNFSNEFLGPSFLALTIIIAVPVVVLIWRLKVKVRSSQLAGESTAFMSEIWKLIVLMILFSISFLTRWVFDSYIIQKWMAPSTKVGSGDLLCPDTDGIMMICNPYDRCIIILTTQFVWDLIPIGAILLFHHHSFRDKDETEEIKSLLDAKDAKEIAYANLEGNSNF